MSGEPLPAVDLDAVEIDRDVANLVPRQILREHQALPLARRGSWLLVALAHQDDGTIPAVIKAACGYRTRLIRAESAALQRRLAERLQSQAPDAVTDPVESASTAPSNTGTSAETSGADGPVTLWVERLLRTAIAEGASDIHLEPQVGGLRVRLRQDGFLHTVSPPPAHLAAGICSRIKIMAQMDITERRKPQDGRFTLPAGHGLPVDLRTNSCPTLHGEKLVIRLLDPAQAMHDISDLGFEPDQHRSMLDALHRPHGLLLVTGPTGSGKTVSLYAALNLLNHEHRNISSVEDPVEIHLDGINQINLNPKAGLDFPTALRALLRQDPDVLMIGEIRDQETAGIAIKAAQTGHLVLSTLHTNSAPESIARLANMGIPGYSLASSINLVIAQRLLRRLCNACKQPDPLSHAALAAIDRLPGARAAAPITLYRALGCPRCVNGYRGRTGIYEVMPVSAAIQALILGNSPASRLQAHCQQAGIINLRGAGLLKVARGITSMDEVLRVTGDWEHA
jgi:type IV pilus assembly protein PilB